MAAPSEPERPAQKLRILVVEDNPVNRRVLELILGRMGYAIDQAVDGVEAVDMAVVGGYHAILMDLHMPRMGGIEATEAIISRLPEPHPRVVAVTADTTEESRRECARVGMKAYLTKPIEPAQLLKEIKLAEEEYCGSVGLRQVG